MNEACTTEEAHKAMMDEINKAYKETPIEPKNVQLMEFAEKIKTRGFLFDPREICKMVDAEAKRQYQELFDNYFKGHHLSTLTSAKEETIAWFMAEEERFAAFKENYLKNPEEVLATPVLDLGPSIVESSNVTEIKPKKGKKK